MKGNGGAFRPQDTSTRAEAAAILSRIDGQAFTDQVVGF
ncbi:MAG: hypothetical protein IJC51_00840 [Eggerthellaceae bacterium]|nr:hypothetical protein [Eggerthellaceae bacterium]